MPVKYHIENCSYRFPGKRTVSAWINRCVNQEGKICGEVNYIFCPDSYLLDINRRFLEHDYLTDVITFDYSEHPSISGDIYISVDTVAANAEKYGVTPRQEMLRVMIHGVLHLCGYKDKTADEEKTMRLKEDFFLNLFDE